MITLNQIKNTIDNVNNKYPEFSLTSEVSFDQNQREVVVKMKSEAYNLYTKTYKTCIGPIRFQIDYFKSKEDLQQFSEGIIKELQKRVKSYNELLENINLYNTEVESLIRTSAKPHTYIKSIDPVCREEFIAQCEEISEVMKEYKLEFSFDELASLSEGCDDLYDTIVGDVWTL